MQIQYCDTCGMRVPEQDLAQGHATREGAKIFCATCRSAVAEPAPGSNPRVTPAAHAPRASSANIIPAARPTRRTSGLRTVRPVGRDDPSSVRLKPATPASTSPASTPRHAPGGHAAPRSKGAMTGLFIGGIGLGLIIVGLLALSSDRTPPAHYPDAVQTDRSPDPSLRQDAPPAGQPVDPAPSVVARSSSNVDPLVGITQPPVPTPEVDAHLDLETQASNAWATWMDTTPADDFAARLARVNEFLAVHGDTIVAAQARLERDKLTARIEADGGTSAPIAQAVPPPQPQIEVDAPAPDPEPETAPVPEIATKPEGPDPFKVVWFAFLPALRAGEYDAAQRVLDEAQVPAGEDEALRTGLAALTKDLERVKHARATAVAAVRAKSGTTVRVQRARGIISGKVLNAGADDSVALKIAGGQLVIIPAAELHTEDIVTWMPAPQDDAGKREAALTQGVLWMIEGEADQAKEAFERAQTAGATDEAARLLTQVPWLEQLKTETAARDAWTKLVQESAPETLNTYEKAVAAAEALTAWRAAYAGTTVAQALAETLEQRTAAVAGVVTERSPRQPGLRGQYFRNRFLKPTEQFLERIEQRVDFQFLGRAENGLPAYFGARWTGYLVAPADGVYSMRIRSDDGVRLWIDGERKVNDYINRSPADSNFKATLTAGSHDLRIDYFNSGSGGECRLYWQPPGETELVLVPDSALNHNPATVHPGTDVPAPKLPEGRMVFVSQLTPTKTVLRRDDTGPQAGVATKGVKIAVNGNPSPHGLGAHPKTDGVSLLQYRLQKAFTTFRCTVALNDSARRSSTKLTFRVKGDGKLLWESKPVEFQRKIQACVVDVRGVDKFELSVDCPGGNGYAHAVWIEPHLLR